MKKFKVFIPIIFVISSMILAIFTLFTIRYASTSTNVLVIILSIIVIVSGIFIALLLDKEDSNN